MPTPTPESLYLRTLAARIGAAYAALPEARAAMLSGSAAEGLSDRFSDVDMTVYYTALLDDAVLDAARRQNGGGVRLWLLGERAAGAFAEAYLVDGVEVQIGHATIATWEHDIVVVLDELDVETPLQKAMEGTLHGIALHGAPQIAAWQARIAAYPDALARKMVTHYLHFPAVWLLAERMDTRDAALWRSQLFVELGYHLLAVLAGLNRVYFSAFQFKRAARLTIKPARLSGRLDASVAAAPRVAVADLEQLVAETVTLVEQHMPDVDTGAVRRSLGRRQTPWAMPRSAGSATPATADA